MKRIYIPFLMILLSLSAQAQTESISIQADGAQRKDFGGYILDMATMLNTESLTLPMPFLPNMSQLTPLLPDSEGLKINPDAWKFNSKAIYTTTPSLNISNSGSLFYPGRFNQSFHRKETAHGFRNLSMIIIRSWFERGITET